MHLTCPQCGQPVKADNINIQQMVAVCAACDTVFPFEPPQITTRRRKTKKPRHLLLRETDTLRMTFRTNFRLDKNESFISVSIGTVFHTIVTAIVASVYFAGEIPVFVPIVFGVVLLLLYYWLGLKIFNKTQIEMDDRAIQIAHKSIPRLLNHVNEIHLGGVLAIHCEETPKSAKEGYDTPLYRVWAQMADGSRRIIVNDVIADYGFFIAQHMQERLDKLAALDVSRLEDEQQHQDDEHNGRVNSQTPAQMRLR